MSFSFANESIDFQLDNKLYYERWLEAVIRNEQKEIGDIKFYFVSKDVILNINRKFLNHSYLTDIITFDGSFLGIVAGEIFICIDVVRENAAIHSKSYFEQELARVLVHGILHLLGFSDGSDKEREDMREREDFYLQRLGKI